MENLTKVRMYSLQFFSGEFHFWRGEGGISRSHTFSTNFKSVTVMTFMYIDDNL